MQAQNLDLRRYVVPNEDRCGELPLLAEEDGAGAREVHRHQRVEQAGGEAALGHQPAEAGAGGERLVEVERVVVAGELGVPANLVRGDGHRAPGALSRGERQRHDSSSSGSGKG